MLGDDLQLPLSYSGDTEGVSVVALLFWVGMNSGGRDDGVGNIPLNVTLVISGGSSTLIGTLDEFEEEVLLRVVMVGISSSTGGSKGEGVSLLLV